jgi:hypothetical protein
MFTARINHFLFFATLICQLLFIETSSAQTEADLSTEVSTHMVQLTEALLKRDSVTLSRLLSDEVTYGHSNGLTQTKAEAIRSVMSLQHEYRRIDTRKQHVRLYGNTAIVNTEVSVSMRFEEKPLELDMDILFVWFRENNQWQLLARQSVRNP